MRITILGLVACLAPLPAIQAQQANPNILIIFADDLSRSELDFIAMPNFDALTQQGMEWTRAYTQPACPQTRATLMFGRVWSVLTGGTCEATSYPDDAPREEWLSLAEHFASIGYHTGLFGKWHLGTIRFDYERWDIAPHVHGFHTARAWHPQNITKCHPVNPNADYFDWLRLDDGTQTVSTEYEPLAVTDALIGYIDEREATEPDQPWFAYVALQLPHSPFHIPDASLLPNGVPPGPLNARELYELMVQAMDTQLGLMMSAVDLSETIVVFFADNGTPSAVTNPIQDPNKVKGTTYEEGIKVPFVMAGPGIPAGVSTPALFHIVDLMPTLSELSGGCIPNSLGAFDGVSQAKVIAGVLPTVRPTVYASLGDLVTFTDHSIISQRFKLRVLNGVEELYDLVLDPSETVNLVDDPSLFFTLSRLREALNQTVASIEPPPVVELTPNGDE